MIVALLLCLLVGVGLMINNNLRKLIAAVKGISLMAIPCGPCGPSGAKGEPGERGPRGETGPPGWFGVRG